MSMIVLNKVNFSYCPMVKSISILNIHILVFRNILQTIQVEGNKKIVCVLGIKMFNTVGLQAQPKLVNTHTGSPSCLEFVTPSFFHLSHVADKQKSKTNKGTATLFFRCYATISHLLLSHLYKPTVNNVCENMADIILLLEILENIV